MKRVLIASGLVLAAAQPALALEPEVNLSGTFGLSLSYFNSNPNTPGVVSTTDVDLENNASNFRISAAAQEGGIRAFMAYERGASNDQLGLEDVREFFGGLSGSLGTLFYGRKSTDYKLAGVRLDPFYDTSVAGFNGGFAREGASYGLSNLTNGFTPNTISYRSPVAFGGLSINGAAYINENNNVTGTGDDADYGIGIGYSHSDWLGLDVGVQVLDLNAASGTLVAGSPGESTAIRAHGSLGEKLWAVGASFESVDVQLEPNPRQYAFASATYQVSEAWRLALAYGNTKDTPFDGNGVTAGGFHDLTKNLSTYAAVKYVALDNVTDTKNITAAVGVKFVFDTEL